MKQFLAIVAIQLLAVTASGFAAGSGDALTSLPAPATVDPVTDDYFGTKVIDNYRWMEAEPEPQFRAYLEHQNDYAHDVLSRIQGRDKLESDIAAMDGLQTVVLTVAATAGKRFYLKRAPGSQISKLFASDASNGSETLLVDPEAVQSSDHHAAIDQYAPSQNGKLISYAISSGGSENSVLHVMEVATGRELPDVIDRAMAAQVSWLPDNSSFVYTRLAKVRPGAAPSTLFDHQRVYLHRLGTDPDNDSVVLDADHLPFAFKAAQVWPSLTVTAGSDQVLAEIGDGTGIDKAFFTASLSDVVQQKSIAWKTVAEQSDGAIRATVHGNRIFLLTHKNAPRFRIVEEDLRQPDFASAKTVTPEGAGVITGLAASSEAIYVTTRNGAAMTLSRLPYGAAKALPIGLPFTGTIYPASMDAGALSADPQSPGAVFGLESWTHPCVWLQYDPKTNAVVDTGIVPKFSRDLSGYDTIETTARSPDGTMVPLSIIMKHGAKLDHSHPTIVEGYGSFGISMDPSFRPSFIAWLDRGGVYAIAHVRGGGELGEPWHRAGMIEAKQNTITDFIACAETLVRLGYTSTSRLAAQGSSGGGITVGGAITQKPDLFAAAVIEVGAVNALRFGQMPVGPNLIPEFGSVSNPAQFPALLKMDAFQQVRNGTRYPAVLLTGGFNDARVSIWMPAKMAARLQVATSSSKPVLLRVDFDAGHGMGSTASQGVAKRADELAFLLWQLGIPQYSIRVDRNQ